MSKKRKNINYEVIKNTLTIPQFLSIYYGVNNLGNRRMIHKNLQSLFPFIKELPMDYAIKNPELFLTMKAILVIDSDNKYVPYLVREPLQKPLDNQKQLMIRLLSTLKQYIQSQEDSFLFNVEGEIDEREQMIIKLLMTLNMMQKNNNDRLIILENNDSIAGNVIGEEYQEIRGTSRELYNLNHNGGIIIPNVNEVYTFQYIVSQFKNLYLACYSKNFDNAIELSTKKDIIVIRVKEQEIYISYNGVTSKALSVLEVRNFLLKYYYPRQQVEEQKKEDVCLDYLQDYELEQLKRKFLREKNIGIYQKISRELRKRNLKKRDEGCKQYKRKKRNLRYDYEEE